MFEKFLDRFARALATLVNILDPDAIVLGGGLSNIEALYTESTSACGALCLHAGGAEPDREEPARRFERRSRGGLALAGSRNRLTAVDRSGLVRV